MMDILKLRGISLFIIAFFSLILALIIWQRAEKDKVKIWLGFSAFFTALYAFFCGGTYFFWKAGTIVSIYWYRTTWLGVLVLPSFIIFTYYFIQNIKRLKIKAFLLYFGAVIISFIALTTNLIVKFVYLRYPNISSLAGNLDFLGRLYILICIALILINLLKEYFKSSGFKRLQLKYFILGVVIFFITGIITTAIIPLIIGESPYYDITAYAAFIWVILTAMAIFKYHFLNIKIIATQFLVFVIWVAALINFTIQDSLRGYLLAGGTLIFMVIAGILLIKSVIKEVAQREQIEKLSVYKTELLSVVAHQIKNPLVAARGYASLGVIGADSDKNKFFTKISLVTGKLINLLNNLLDLSRIEDGETHYDFDKIEVNKFIGEIIDDFKFLIGNKGLEMIFIPANEEVVIKGDNYKLSQVFKNLIDNAIKYTDKGWIKVEISIDRGEQKVLIAVSDSGRGISEEFIKSVFEKFSRQIEDERILGSGLGLYISRKFVMDHRGEIRVESDEEKGGSKFIVSLPISF